MGKSRTSCGWGCKRSFVKAEKVLRGSSLIRIKQAAMLHFGEGGGGIAASHVLPIQHHTRGLSCPILYSEENPQNTRVTFVRSDGVQASISPYGVSGTSNIRNPLPVGPYSRTMPRDYGGLRGVGGFL